MASGGREPPENPHIENDPDLVMLHEHQ